MITAVGISIITNSIYILLAGIAVVLIFLFTTIKKSLISIILLYQKYAPENLRKSCLYEPSCSEYMLLAIHKYGVFKGSAKGIKRLFRCHQPNGGIDYP
ncbi:MAG: membrane protein insertion efficiency factor YidD [Eubacterium sp.]|nr:membrane protein insertion efficiency factor YidD [Eubacterium sp.]